VRTLRFDSDRIAALAREVSGALALGPVAFPAGTDDRFRERARGLLAAPLVARLAVETGWSGYGLAFEPLLRAVLAHEPGPVGFGVPAPGADLDPRTRLLVETGSRPGRGPTVVDFTARPPRVDFKGELGILELEERLDGPVKLGPELVFAVLVVCTGNSCRSPMAAGILERLLTAERAFVESAGTAAPVGSPATGNAVLAAAEHGADLGAHRARQLDAALIRRADLVLVMENAHRRRVASLVAEAAPRTRLLGEYVPGAAPGAEIADPVGRPLEEYRRVAADIARACERVAAEVTARLTDGTENGRT
jgi:protein-tyrosine phosphatase